MQIKQQLLLPLLLIFFTMALSAQSTQSQAILKLDTKGHTGRIWDIIVTKDKNIISASDDKTIRVWDSKTGREKRKILGQIGSGSEGKIFAIALSPDERYLAVGGYLNYNGNYEYGNIRIYNYQTGKLLQVLKSHTNVVFDLAFSQDGRYLISGSGDTTAKIWKQSGGAFTLKDTIKTHTNDVYGVNIIQKASKQYAITAGDDNKISLYNIGTKETIKSDRFNYRLQYLAHNQNNIAVSGDSKEITIYDYNLNKLKTIQSKTEQAGLNYSKDGRYLIAGAGSYPNIVNIYNTKNYNLVATFKKHTNLTRAVNFLDKQTAVSGGGDNNEIYIWDIKTTKVKKKIEGAGATIWSVGIKGDRVAWGNTWTANYGKTKLQKLINLKDFKISTIKNQNFNRISTTNGSYTLQHRRGGDYGCSDALLDIKKGATTVATITKGSINGYEHLCYGWYKDMIVSGGAHGHLKVYNKQGKEIASLVGHTGEIWSIALDGDRLVSGSGDQTIKVWDLSGVSAHSSDVKIYPALNIFVSKNNEYVVWTKEGFFTASKAGAQYIGYHINQGVDQEARYVSVDKLYDTYYRPDLVAKSLQGEDISSYAEGISINSLLQSGFAPEVKILTSKKYSKTRDLDLELQVCTIDNGGYDNLTLLLNGMAVDVIGKDRALKLKKQNQNRTECFTVNKLVSLQNGVNKIGFKATNRAGTIESNLDEITLHYKGRSSGKPDLYLLSIGVDKYRDGDLWLKYSKADAQGFTNSIKKASKPLFKHIYTYSLTDRDVTKSKILSTFKKIGAKTTREDVFILYVAGHGITDVKTGAYFYLPVDFRYKNDKSVRTGGLSQKDFKLALSKIQAMKSLVILDTCNSGSFAEAMASRGVLQKTAINKLTRATGRATIVASSKDQVALEGYKGHGVFTYTLMEALKGKGYGSDNKITIKELAGYVEDVLPDRTYDKWGYEQVPQSNITGNDFPIGVK